MFTKISSNKYSIRAKIQFGYLVGFHGSLLFFIMLFFNSTVVQFCFIIGGMLQGFSWGVLVTCTFVFFTNSIEDDERRNSAFSKTVFSNYVGFICGPSAAVLSLYFFAEEIGLVIQVAKDKN